MIGRSGTSVREVAGPGGSWRGTGCEFVFWWRDITDITRAGSKQTSNTKLTSRAIFGLTNAFDNLCSYCHRCSLFDFEELVHLVCGSHRDVWNWKLNSNGKRWFREAEKDRGVRRTKDESDRTKDEKTSRLPKPRLLPICKPFLSVLLACCC